MLDPSELMRKLRKFERRINRTEIKPPGTGAPYSSGTWTPTYLGSATPGTTTYTLQDGTYVQIGTIVFFRGVIVWSAATGTGDARISLPFTSAGANNYTSGSLRLTSVTFANSAPEMLIDPGTAYFTMDSPLTNANPTKVQMEAAGNVVFSGFFIVAGSAGGGVGAGLTVKEQDGTPTVVNVGTIKVSNGTLTDNGGGIVSITTGGGGGGLPPDGDYGDITVSSSGAVWTIDNDVVTYAKMQNMTTDRVLGRDTAGSGDVEELTVSGGLEFTGSVGIQRSALTGDVTASAGSNATTIANDAVTYAKMQNVSATDKLLGRVSAGSGDVEEVTFTDFGQSLMADATRTANTVLAGPTSGAAAAPAFRALVAADILDMLITGTAGVLFNHFFNNLPGTAAGGSGGLEVNANATGGYTIGAVTPPTADAIGVLSISTGTASGGGTGSVYSSVPGTQTTLAFGTVMLDLTWRFRIDALPASGQDYKIVIGFANARSPTASNAAFLFLDFAAGFTDFRYRTRAAGVQTDVGSGLTAAANTWYKLQIHVDTSGNVIFTIDGANSQTLSTNVPSGTTQSVTFLAHSERVSGTNVRQLFLDYVRLAWSGGPS